MGKKYLIKEVDGIVYENWLCSGDIIELEELEEEKERVCPKCGHDEFWLPRTCNEAGELDGLVCEKCGCNVEQVDCPASACTGEECECKILPEESMKHITDEGIISLQNHLKRKTKEPNASLEEKMLAYYEDFKEWNDRDNSYLMNMLKCIAKEHYQLNPEELEN